MNTKAKPSSKRQAILNAAEALIRDTGATDFTMLLLATRAGVSPATPYNVFGTKASILYVLLNESLDGIFSRFDEITTKREPFEVVLAAADAAAGFFLVDPDFYRPLYQHLIGVRDPVHRSAYMDRALGYWRVALTGLRSNGTLAGDLERDTLARAIMIQFLGGMDLWAQSELSSEEFHAHIMHGVTSLLLGVAEIDKSKSLKKHLRAAMRVMPKEFSFRRALPPADTSSR